MSDTRPERLEALAQALAEQPLWLDLADAAEGRRTRDELTDQIRGYLIPRLARLNGPLLVVLGGSTGSGKSSITNALARETVAIPGVLRPTTRRPVLVCHPDDAAWFTADNTGGPPAILPDLPRTTGGSDDRADADGIRVVTSSNLVPGMAFLDSPDIDSVETANHDLAALLLGAADLWLFVTTAVRYADAVPWAYLARAAERSVATAVVVNRIPPGAESEVAAAVRAMLDERSLSGAALFAVAEGGLDRDVAPIRDWLASIAVDDDARRRVVSHTVDGLIASVPDRIDTVVAAVATQEEARAAMVATAQAVWEEAATRVDAALDDGVAIREEALARFSEHVGTSEVMGRIQNGIGRLRDRVGAALRGRPAPATEVRQDLGATVEDLILRIADSACLELVDRWQTLPGGRQVLSSAPAGIERSGAHLRPAARRSVEEWQTAVVGLVVERAGSKLAVAKTVSLGINGVAAALMIGVFSHTGGLTGGEAVIAGGAAAASQTVLSAVFGDQAIRDLVRAARADLLERVRATYADERQRFIDLLGPLPQRDHVDWLAHLTREVAGP